MADLMVMEKDAEQNGIQIPWAARVHCDASSVLKEKKGFVALNYYTNAAVPIHLRSSTLRFCSSRGGARETILGAPRWLNHKGYQYDWLRILWLPELPQQ